MIDRRSNAIDVTDALLHIWINGVIRVFKLFRIINIWIFYSEGLDHVGGHCFLIMHIRYHILRRGYDLMMSNGRLFEQLSLGIDQQLGHGRVVLLRRIVRCGHRERGRRRAGQLLRLALLRVSV